MCPEHIKTHIHLNLTRLPDYASVRSEIETFLEARQSSSNPDAMDIGSLNGQKGVCHNWGQRGHWTASCPKRSKSDQGGKGDNGKRQGKKGKSSKGKSAGSFDESEKNGPENTSVGGFGLCPFRKHCDDWKWNNCRRVTFTLNSGAAVSAAPKPLGDDYPMQIEEPRSYKTATVLLCKTKDFECCRL